jgi:hypothetical protein
LVNELQLRSTEMKLLNEMGDLLQCCANAEEAYLVVATSVRKLLPTATAGVLYIFKPSRKRRGRRSHVGSIAGVGAGLRSDGVLGAAPRATALERVPPAPDSCANT